MLQRFLPLLAMTFFICLFIVLMQFLFRYIDDLVGKGLPISVIGELFFYAALTMVPTALPLAVLLASLMTFGNLGEKFELTAMKAAGVSLFRIMRPLIILMVLLAIGAFFFQNNVLPIAQTKMWTLLFSMRQKSPEVEIPVRTFYDQIPGMNLYVEKKNLDTGMLYDLIIYDVSQGWDNSRVILADSGKLNFTEDKTHMFLHLYRGEMFENLRSSSLGTSNRGYLPFRRESFADKQIYLKFDANFNRMDESNIRSQYVGKNISELSQSIDSIQHIVDSIGDIYGNDLKRQSYVNIPAYVYKQVDTLTVEIPSPPVVMKEPLDIDSVFAAPSLTMAKTYLTQALQTAKQQKENYEFRSMVLHDQAVLMNRHGIEMHRKFTLSFACLVFFFIGAPLGAIIKKGGIGTPLVISVMLFIVYFIIDNMGFKMARDGKMEVWEGIWLSSAVLLPLGIFFTYKAVNDSAVFNADAYINLLLRLIGKQTKRSLYVKDVIMSEVDAHQAIEKLSLFITHADSLYRATRHRNISARLLRRKDFASLTDELNSLVEYLSNSRDPKVIAFINQWPMHVNFRNLRDTIKNSQHLLAHIDTNSEISLMADTDQPKRTRITAWKLKKDKMMQSMRISLKKAKDSIKNKHSKTTDNQA